MKGRYWLGRLRNEEQELLAALRALVRHGNELTADLLAHLAELDERKLFLELGFPSLFAYCTESLGLSESSAGRRITAARVGRRLPTVLAAVARGDLNLSILCTLNPDLNQENAAGLFEACSGKKRQQVEEILAARFPRRDVRESIRRLPVRVAAEVVPSPVECSDDAGATAQQTEATPAFPEPQRRKASRHIPAAVAREVYIRDQGGCSFISADGRRCSARVLLEVDHDQPFAVGGAATADNLRLRCQAHNQLHARRYFGRAHVAAAIKRGRVTRADVTNTRVG